MTLGVRITVARAVDDSISAPKLLRQQLPRAPEQAWLLLSQRHKALCSAGIPELAQRSTVVVSHWKGAVGSTETLAVGLSIRSLPVADACRERWGKSETITW